MIELSSSLQTADDVKQIIEDTLRSFECNVQQIVSVTTDNGCELLNHCLQLDKDLGEDDDEGLHSTNIDISALLDNYQISSTARCARNASHILRVRFSIIIIDFISITLLKYILLITINTCINGNLE